MSDKTETVDLECRYCGKKLTFPAASLEALSIFNVFCPDGECEDKYAGTL